MNRINIVQTSNPYLILLRRLKPALIVLTDGVFDKTLFRCLYFLVPLWLSLLPLPALTLQVAIDGSQPYDSIQTAINASVNGDTVLVHPGRYFENVLFNGKIITLCSLEATTNDSSYISSTIIDGNRAGSCVRFYHQEQGAALRGFTLEHGIGYPFGAQHDRSGGGVFAYIQCNVTIQNCTIKNNFSTSGGGIFAYQASLTLMGVDIHHNYSSASGGGILIYGTRNVVPNVVFDQTNRCSIYENYSTKPCDIYVIDVMANLNFYLDLVSVANPGDFYIGRHANFTQTQGYTDTVHYLQPYRREANRDLYVSPDGDDTNSGYFPTAAMKTIAKAVHKIAEDSTDVKTVHILPGTYSSEDQLYPPIPLRSFVNIVGAGADSTFFIVTDSIDGIANNVVSGIKLVKACVSGIGISSIITDAIIPIHVNSTSQDFTISNMSIHDALVYRYGSIKLQKPTNLLLHNVKVTDITAVEIGALHSSEWISGSIIDCVFSNIVSIFDHPEGEPMTMFDLNLYESLSVQNCIFRDFYTAPDQPAFHISNNRIDDEPVNVNISNCLFSNHHSDAYYPISFNNRSMDSFKISNCTFINNEGTFSAIGLIGNIQLQNNIFYNPACNYELMVRDSPPLVPVSNIYMDYNNLRGGIGSIVSNASTSNIYYADTNISTPPMFRSLHHESPHYAQLAEGSPCINSATPDTTGLGLLPYDLAGNYRVWDGRIDMGCYEYDAMSYVSVADLLDILPPSGFVLSTYPNPFAREVNIRYNLQKASQVNLQVYNLRGQLLKTIISDRQSKGEQLAVWEGTDDAGRQLASGIYFLRTSIDGKPQRPCRLVLTK
ncbi:MAG: T9SS type A sorting domain-containing protein [Candidatus Cloacimonetes bacterium]|nr:T9SS type A sorting domain-containing protein [Candidatus Cloacimonadota bacterium]MDD2423433.1 T9SS type A sorting domain-containing protein [Candidatus Cloacimonadota bacterium]MDD4276483.1 T9SS type A sorting domain-containing protein [Candidatus Cloacimonadota bacterium]